MTATIEKVQEETGFGLLGRSEQVLPEQRCGVRVVATAQTGDDGGARPKTEPEGDDPVTDPRTDPRTNPGSPRPNEPQPEEPNEPGLAPGESDERST
ncbi:hypothetical protein KV102_10085 [Mumia sp. zg.B53]|uniref:hypothetical protein n=1 Tax=unclassified Mumia TaxID=2621872 RepID=UPI001C6F2A16|nr:MULTISPECIES: hypothetical protein [unclassified Mumia]MBW9207089.1 hypothetical protein [Mumia sp. zg.B17]MBW9210575.1 hypothetical protein [Mumia sp. zg.B21]MBW9215188.1 hypothetical protein [Mumia sp. zg.B53]MDD9347589.1 hypothetical protein [Mumia sp.]